MPMIVDPSAPEVTPADPAVSPDGWLTATVDGTWAGVFLRYDATVGTPYGSAADVRHVAITRTDPGAVAVPVRSADTAWAVGGTGVAYDSEAPLGVAVAYTATPVLVNGTVGPASSLSVTVPAPASRLADVWVKSLEALGSSVLVTVTAWPQLAFASRHDTATVLGSAFSAVALDVYSAPTSSITIQAEGDAIEALRALLASPQVLLLQTVPGYHRPDAYVVMGDVTEDMQSTPDQPRTFIAAVMQVERPDTAGQPLGLPGWSWDAVAAEFATWDAVTGSYASFASLALNGAL
jgi:hypothetical protein